MANNNFYLDIFLGDTRDSSIILIADISSYPTNFTPLNPSLEITPPAYPKINVEFTPRAQNIYRSIDLEITCDDELCTPLPDGIYKVKYTIDNNVNNCVSHGEMQRDSVEKKFMKVDRIMCKYITKYDKVYGLCDCMTERQKQLIRILDKIKLLINGSIAAADECDDKGAYLMYQKADKLLDSLDCETKFPCGC